jgi:hypothetical protein
LDASQQVRRLGLGLCQASGVARRNGMGWPGVFLANRAREGAVFWDRLDDFDAQSRGPVNPGQDRGVRHKPVQVRQASVDAERLPLFLEPMQARPDVQDGL